MFRFFLNQRRSSGEGGFTLIELVVSLVILGILLSLAVPRYLTARKRAFKSEIDNILLEAKTLSWAYYQEHEVFPSSIANISLQMPAGAAWDTPVLTGGGAATPITWTASGLPGGAVVEPADLCSVTLSATGAAGQGCSF